MITSQVYWRLYEVLTNVTGYKENPQSIVQYHHNWKEARLTYLIANVDVFIHLRSDVRRKACWQIRRATRQTARNKILFSPILPCRFQWPVGIRDRNCPVGSTRGPFVSLCSPYQHTVIHTSCISLFVPSPSYSSSRPNLYTFLYQVYPLPCLLVLVGLFYYYLFIKPPELEKHIYNWSKETIHTVQ